MVGMPPCTVQIRAEGAGPPLMIHRLILIRLLLHVAVVVVVCSLRAYAQRPKADLRLAVFHLCARRCVRPLLPSRSVCSRPADPHAPCPAISALAHRLDSCKAASPARRRDQAGLPGSCLTAQRARRAGLDGKDHGKRKAADNRRKGRRGPGEGEERGERARGRGVGRVQGRPGTRETQRVKGGGKDRGREPVREKSYKIGREGRGSGGEKCRDDRVDEEGGVQAIASTLRRRSASGSASSSPRTNCGRACSTSASSSSSSSSSG